MILPLTLLLCVGASPPRESAVVLTASQLEEYVLPLTGVELEVDEYAFEVRLRSAEALGPAARLLSRSKLCPTSVQREGALVLRCVTGRLEAVLSHEGKKSSLSLRALRGLPWRNQLSARTRLPVEQFALGGPCPGQTPDARAECLVEAGQLEAALTAFEGAVTTQLVSLRRGDLLVLLRQDAAAALKDYEAAGSEGTLGRLAHLRRCELVGCRGSRDPYELTAMRGAVREEMELRQIRALALDGERERAAHLLSTRLSDDSRPSPCEGWPELCVGVTSAALSDADPAARASGLTLYVQLLPQLPNRDARLARQAADVAASLGAWRFAANVMAAVTDRIPAAQLGGHLERTAALFDGARDPVRAGVIREYALVKLRQKPRAPAKVRPPPEDLLLQRMGALMAASEQDLALASALETSSRARTVGQ